MFTEYVAELKDAVARGELHINSALDMLHTKFKSWASEITPQFEPNDNTAGSASEPKQPVGNWPAEPGIEQSVTEEAPANVDPEV